MEYKLHWMIWQVDLIFMSKLLDIFLQKFYRNHLKYLEMMFSARISEVLSQNNYFCQNVIHMNFRYKTTIISVSNWNQS